MAAEANTNIIAQIAKGAVTIWDDVEGWFTTAVAKVNAVLPGAAAVETSLVSEVKQGASDVLSAVGDGVLTPAEQALITGIDGLADAAMTAASGGTALPLVPMTNTAINGIVNKGYAALQAWALKQSAALAENTAAKQTGGQ